MTRGSRNQQTARAGEYFVAAEINRRGANAVTLTGNAPRIDVIAWNSKTDRRATIQVKTKTSGDWQTSTREARQGTEVDDETGFWVFADLSKDTPEYCVVPEWWIRNNIYETYQAYLERHGGRRPVNPNSTHHRVQGSRIAQWKDRWHELGIFEDEQ